MEVYLFGVIFILILLPILYFIPIGINLKEKVLIAIVSFILAEIGLFLNQFLGIWKTLLILVLLAVVVTYIVETRIRPRLVDKGRREVVFEDNGGSPDLLIKKEEPILLDSDGDHESDGDYDLGQEAIDRLLSEMNKSKTEQIEGIPNVSLDDIQNRDFDIQNEDYIEPVKDTFVNKENTDDEIEVIQPENTSLATQTDIDVRDIEELLNEEISPQNQEVEIDVLPEEDPSILAKSIDADFEIDFEKQLEDHTSENSHEVNNSYEDELLLERSKLFDHLNELEGGNDRIEELSDTKPIDEVEVEENQSTELVESLMEQLDEINPIEELLVDEPVEPNESVLEALEEIEPIEKTEGEKPEESIENMLDELDVVAPTEQTDANQHDEPIEEKIEELDEVESIEQAVEDQQDELIEDMIEELEEVLPNEQTGADHHDESMYDIVDELEEILPNEKTDADQPNVSIDDIVPIEQTKETQPEESIEDVLDDLDEIGQTEQIKEVRPVESIEGIANPDQSDHFVDDLLEGENEQQEIEESHKIMDDIEDITTSEELQKGDTIVEEYVLEEKDDDNTSEEISETRSEIQRQMLQTMVTQLNFSKSRLSDEEYENLVLEYMHPSLPALEYYTFAYMLIEHYISKGQFDKLTLLINELYNKFEKYPVIKLQLDYLIEKYNNS